MMTLLLMAIIGCSSPRINEPPSKWNALNAGMTREEVTTLLGQPSGHPSVNRDLWRSKGWELQVDYDQNGRARDIMRRPAH
jgi:hypothetical protein